MKAEVMGKQKKNKVHQYVLYAMITLSAVVFALFYFVGYDKVYEDSPGFVAPLFTDAVLIFTILMLITTLVMVIWSAIAFFKRGDKDKETKRKTYDRVRIATFSAVAVMLLTVFLLSSSEPILINGQAFSNAFLLQSASMFITGSAIIVAVLIGLIVYDAMKKERE